MFQHVFPPHRLEAYAQPLYPGAAGIARCGQGSARPDRFRILRAPSLHYDAETILGSLANPQAHGLRSPAQRPAQRAPGRSRLLPRAARRIDLDPESLVLTTSTSEGYSYVFRLLCNPDDEVLVPKPSYPLFEFLADLQDVKLVPYPLLYDHGWQIDFPFAVQSGEPSHARGRGGSSQQSHRLVRQRDGTRRAESFLSRTQLALVVDEVFLDYAHDGAPRPTFVTNRDVLTFTLSGVSKISGLPQMKLAWIVTSGPADQAVRGAGASGSDRRHVSVDECAHPAGSARAARSAQSISSRLLLDRVRTNLAELDRQLAKQKACQRLARRRWMVRSAAGSGDAIRRRPGD